MESDIYKACRNGDIDLVQVLIETSPRDADINRLEPNGSTALHIACSKGYTNIVRLLLNNNSICRHKKNKDGRTAYEVASTEEIRQLFHRPIRDNNPFCTDENTLSPLKFITNEDCQESQWIHTYPSDAPIMMECFHEVLDDNRNAYISIFNWFRSLFGSDPHKKKIDKWFEELQVHIRQCLIDEYQKRNCEPDYKLYFNACKCIEEYAKTRNIEHLLRLYTLHTSICQYLAENSDKTNYLYAPIRFSLFDVRERSYRGLSFRGLKMKENEFAKYQHAFHYKGTYIKTKTFCSTSMDPSVAKCFTSTDKINDIVNVIMVFDFVEICSTALILCSYLPQLKCISNYEDEQEVLILPETVFSVINIQEDNQTHMKTIYLKHYNTDEEKAEMAQDRLHSFIDTFILD